MLCSAKNPQYFRHAGIAQRPGGFPVGGFNGDFIRLQAAETRD
jgi:hypothetical protein